MAVHAWMFGVSDALGSKSFEVGIVVVGGVCLAIGHYVFGEPVIIERFLVQQELFLREYLDKPHIDRSRIHPKYPYWINRSQPSYGLTVFSRFYT